MEAESNGFATTAENATAPVCHGCEAATDFFAFAFSDDDHTSYFMLVSQLSQHFCPSLLIWETSMR